MLLKSEFSFITVSSCFATDGRSYVTSLLLSRRKHREAIFKSQGQVSWYWTNVNWCYLKSNTYKALSTRAFEKCFPQRDTRYIIGRQWAQFWLVVLYVVTHLVFCSTSIPRSIGWHLPCVGCLMDVCTSLYCNICNHERKRFINEKCDRQLVY